MASTSTALPLTSVRARSSELPVSRAMAKPNYAFQKRQRELAKKQKKEEKLRQKQANSAASGDASQGPETPGGEAEAGGIDETKPAA